MIRLAVEKQCRWTDRGRRHICRNWNDCAGRAWYAIGDIERCYCHYQVLWMLSCLIEYDEASEKFVAAQTRWPDEGKTSGYTAADGNVQRSGTSSAGFEGAMDTIDEICARLDRTGTDGRLLYHEANNARNFQGGETADYSRLSREAKAALGYVSGRKRKRMGYTDWKKQRRRRRIKVKEIE